jgi:peptidyl-tRNA hydrolase
MCLVSGYTTFEGLAMRLKIVFRKNLKMTPGKIAAQSVHAATGISHTDYMMSVVVLGVSDKKFNEIIATEKCFVVNDAGYTEVEPGTATCAAYYAA